MATQKAGKKVRRRKRKKTAFDTTFTMSEITFVMQYWHERDPRRGPDLTDDEIEESRIGKTLGRKMMGTWGYWCDMLKPGHFRLEPGQVGLDPMRARESHRVRSRVVEPSTPANSQKLL
jgi:hypothetical protein